MKTLKKGTAFLIALLIVSIASIFGSAVLAQSINVAVTTTVVSGVNQATFTATENGTAKPNVQIYVDGVSSGQTGSNGTYMASGLTTGTHAWEAEYGGGTVGIGKFVFFGYGILATGTSSPALGFNYTITASGTQYSYESQYRKAEVRRNPFQEKHEVKTWFRIDYTQPVHLLYYYDGFCLGCSADYFDGGERCVDPSRGEYQTLTPGDWYLYASASGGLKKSYAQVEIWFTSRTGVPWSATETGSSSVSATEGSKYITTSSLNAQAGDTFWSVEDNNPYVNTTMVGNRLFANTNYTQDWSQTETGTGGVSDNDLNKLVATSSSEGAPNKDTAFSLAYIKVDDVVVRDQDPDDLDRNLNTIEYEGVIAWMQGKELHASMSYHPPAAFIDSISPTRAQVGEAIAFSGHGEDQDTDDRITAYKWRSHKDGELNTLDHSFTTTELSAGRHVIYFQVADNTPYTPPYTPLWSPEATESIRVNKPPTAKIHSIKGSGVDADGYPTLILGDSMTFQGVGIDTDGYITGYEWYELRSNSGKKVLSTSESFSISKLPIGHHTIYFKVKDNDVKVNDVKVKDGVWSKEVAKEIIVRRTPVVFIRGYNWQPFEYGKISYRPEILDPKGTEGESNLLIEPRTGDLIDWAHKLSDEIYKLKRDTGTRKVDIVAYSAGGLTARWYIEKGYRNDVRKFISMASPHHGLDIGYWTWLIEWAEPEKGGGRQITPHSHFLNKLNGHDGCATTRGRGTDQIKHDIPYYVITGNCRFTWLHLHKKILGIDFRSSVYSNIGDGWVPAESARLDGAEYTDEFCGKHSDYHTRSDVREKITEILHDDSLAHQNIVQASSARTLTPQFQNKENPLDSTENVLTAFHWSDPISDTISAGGIKSHPTHIEPDITKAIFELQGDCELDMVLFTPNGVAIDSSDSDITFTKKGGYIVYEISNPDPGQWTLEVTESGVADSECSYAIRTFMETELFVAVGTDRNEYQPNDPMKIYASVQDGGAPLGGAAVTTEIQKPDASSVTIALFDDGNHDDGEANDGIYANTFEDSSVRGAYDILVTATIPKDGKTYSRSAWTTVWVDLFPDLAVSDSDIAFSNINPAHGDPVTMTATIHNIGDTDANDVNILFFDGDPAESGVAIGEKIVDLAAGTITDLSVSWKAVHGIHTIHVIISPFNDFLEQRYDNNRASADITVEDPEMPVADAGPDRVALVDTPVFFDGSGSTDNAGIVNYTWDIDTSVDSDGDGIPDNDVDLTGVHPVYAGGYHSTGTYIVKLSVHDADGNGPVSDTLMVDVTSEYDLEPPNAIAGADQTVSLRVPVFFDASPSNDNFGIASYQWDIDISVDSDQDGIPDNDVDLIGMRPILDGGYAASGPHTVQLTIDDVAGNGPAVDTLTVTVINRPPIADAAGPYVADEGTLVTLDGNASEDPDGNQLQYRWDFDNDGTWDTEWSAVSSAYYTWGDDHSGVVRLEVSDGDLRNRATAEVAISNAAPTVEAGSDKIVETGDLVSFSGIMIDPGELDTHTIDWDFGDGSTATGDLTAHHRYDEIGEYSVELTVTDDDGGTEKDTLLVSVVLKTSPEVLTNAATDVTINSAVLEGTLVDMGAASSVQVVFKWGLDTSYGHETIPLTLTSPGSFSIDLSGLSSGTTYHFRAKAVGDGISYGEDMTFTTGSIIPIPTPEPTVIPEPATIFLLVIGLLGILSLSLRNRKNDKRGDA